MAPRCSTISEARRTTAGALKGAFYIGRYSFRLLTILAASLLWLSAPAQAAGNDGEHARRCAALEKTNAPQTDLIAATLVADRDDKVEPQKVARPQADRKQPGIDCTENQRPAKDQLAKNKAAKIG